jgi:hypothetical protein
VNRRVERKLSPLMSALSCFLVACAILPVAGPDQVKLVQGDKVLEGRVVFEGKDEIVLRAGSRDQRIERKDIAEIQSLERSLAPILDRDLRTGDAATFEALAQECQKAGLENEAKNFWLRVLLADPKNEAAAKAVGAQRVLEEVAVPFGKDRRKLADLAKRQASWKDAFELTSTHFLLKTDLDLPFALDITVALERFYQRFYDTLGSPLELYVFDESPEIDIYGSSKDFPVGPLKSDTIWFAPGVNQLHVLAAADPSVAAVVHELSKQMLFNALRRSAGTTAQVPQWTSNGIARMFSLAAPAERFGPWSDLGKPDPESFALAQRAKLGLEKVFNANVNDFNSSPQQAEMTAGAYTLVHYLVFGQGGELRPKYGQFLRAGAKGKISLQALSDALGMPRKDIESGWLAHIDANAH